MAELLRSRDFEVFLTKKTKDGGTDIIALQNMAGLPFKMLIECKRYTANRKIYVEIIRGFSHVVNTNKANKGIIFTTSYFTADAKKEQELSMPYLLGLRDYHDIIQWVNAYVE
jgi:restriction system protein